MIDSTRSGALASVHAYSRAQKLTGHDAERGRVEQCELPAVLRPDRARQRLDIDAHTSVSVARSHATACPRSVMAEAFARPVAARFQSHLRDLPFRPDEMADEGHA